MEQYATVGRRRLLQHTNHYKQLLSGRLNENDITEAAQRLKTDYLAYICGPPKMISFVRSALQSNNYKPVDIFSEDWSTNGS